MEEDLIDQGVDIEAEVARIRLAEDRARSAAVKKLRYMLLTARGVKSVNAVRRAGFNSGSRHSARAMAAKLDKDLASTAGLKEALELAGMTHEIAAELLMAQLESLDPDVAGSALDRIAKYMRWGLARDENPPDSPLKGLTQNEIVTAQEQLLATVEALKARAETPAGPRKAERGAGPAGRPRGGKRGAASR